MMKKVHSEIDKFDQDLTDKKIEFKPEAGKLKVYQSVKGMLGKAKEQDVGEFQSYLGEAIADYKTTVNPSLKWYYAQECLRYIKIAYQYNVISTDLDKRREALEEENRLLRKTKEELETKVNDQKKLLDLRGVHEFSIPQDEDEHGER